MKEKSENIKYELKNYYYKNEKYKIVTYGEGEIIGDIETFLGRNYFLTDIFCNTDSSLVYEISFTDLSTSNYYYKIGGLDGVVYRSGNSDFNSPVNVFLNTDLVDFPIVKPGENSLEFIQQAVGQIKSASISFYPTFVV